MQITLREIMDEVGIDAARYLTMRSPDSHFDFDLESQRKVTRQSNLLCSICAFTVFAQS